MWGSKDVEVENGAHPYVKPEVRVEAQDTQTKQNIEKELMQELKNRNGTRYTFDNQTRLFTMTFPDGRKGYEGTYKCRVDSLIMQTQSIIKKAIIYYFTQQNKSATAVIVVVVTNILI